MLTDQPCFLFGRGRKTRSNKTKTKQQCGDDQTGTCLFARTSTCDILRLEDRLTFRWENLAKNDIVLLYQLKPRSFDGILKGFRTYNCHKNSLDDKGCIKLKHNALSKKISLSRSRILKTKFEFRAHQSLIQSKHQN